MCIRDRVKGEQGNLLRSNGITGLQQSLHLLLVSGFQIHLEVDIRRVVNYAKQLPGNGKALSLNGLFKSLLRHNFFLLFRRQTVGIARVLKPLSALF